MKKNLIMAAIFLLLAALSFAVGCNIKPIGQKNLVVQSKPITSVAVYQPEKVAQADKDSSVQPADTEPPVIAVYPFLGSIEIGSTVTFIAYDNSGIHHIGYVWDKGKKTKPIYASTVSIPVPSTTGRHRLHFYAKDNSVRHNSTAWRYSDLTVVSTNPPQLKSLSLDEDRLTFSFADPAGLFALWFGQGYDIQGIKAGENTGSVEWSSDRKTVTAILWDYKKNQELLLRAEDSDGNSIIYVISRHKCTVMKWSTKGASSTKTYKF